MLKIYHFQRYTMQYCNRAVKSFDDIASAANFDKTFRFHNKLVESHAIFIKRVTVIAIGTVLSQLLPLSYVFSAIRSILGEYVKKQIHSSLSGFTSLLKVSRFIQFISPIFTQQTVIKIKPLCLHTVIEGLRSKGEQHAIRFEVSMAATKSQQ